METRSSAAGVRGSLPSNRRLYEKLGYRLVASRQYPNGTDVDLTLAKPLEASRGAP